LVQIAKNVNGRVTSALKNQIHRHETPEQLLGCTLAEYKTYLENQFEPGMTWDNWGRWNVDHVVPVSSVDLCNPLSRIKIFNYTNTRPMWTDKNLKKSASTTTPALLMQMITSPMSSSTSIVTESKNVRFNDVPVTVMIQSCDGLERIASNYQDC
jgi:hypothetical protein